MTRRIIEQAAHKFPQKESFSPPPTTISRARKPASNSFWDTRTGIILLGIGSAALSIIVGTAMWGFPFAIVFTALIFLHECGHAWANIRLGIPVKRMIFIPLLGAFVSSYDSGETLKRAFVGLMGPVFGTVGSLICAGIGLYEHSWFWMNMANVNVIITLFNLLPFRPLDGHLIVPIFQTPRYSYGGTMLRTNTKRKSLQAGYIGLAVLLLVYLVLAARHPLSLIPSSASDARNRPTSGLLSAATYRPS